MSKAILASVLTTATLATGLSFLSPTAAQAAPVPQALPEVTAPTFTLNPDPALLNKRPSGTTSTTKNTTVLSTYTVRRGDTLSRIARAQGVSIQNIMNWNDIRNANLIRVGQVLKIYKSKTVTVTSTGAGTNLAAWQCRVASGDTRNSDWSRKVRTRISTQFGINTIYGMRPGDPGDHGQGLALDVMVPNSSRLGDTVAVWARNNAKALNIKYVIWKQHIWAPYRDAEGWRLMPDRGSITQNHYDHVHLSFYSGSGTCPA